MDGCSNQTCVCKSAFKNLKRVLWKKIMGIVKKEMGMSVGYR
jgi:hypothetical protein